MKGIPLKDFVAPAGMEHNYTAYPGPGLYKLPTGYLLLHSFGAGQPLCGNVLNSLSGDSLITESFDTDIDVHRFMDQLNVMLKAVAQKNS